MRLLCNENVKQSIYSLLEQEGYVSFGLGINITYLGSKYRHNVPNDLSEYMAIHSKFLNDVAMGTCCNRLSAVHYVDAASRQSTAGHSSNALLLLGTQFPDLIDKSLAWTLALLPAGRSLGHSLLILVPLLIFVYLLAVRYRHAEWASAFAIGAISHVVVNVLPSVIHGEYAYTTSLLWPLLPASPYDERDHTILGYFLSIEPTSMIIIEAILTIMVFIIWWYDGKPGFDTIYRVLNR